ncbi:tropomyosin-like isoform X2 [Lampetra fluviatilis]
MGKQVHVTRAELSRAEQDLHSVLDQLNDAEHVACEYKKAMCDLEDRVLCGEQTIDEQCMQLKRAREMLTETECQFKEANRVLRILEGDLIKSEERACCSEQGVVQLEKKLKKLKEELLLMFRNEEMLLHSEKMYEKEMASQMERLHDMEVRAECAEKHTRKLEKVVHQLEDKLSQAECVNVDLESEMTHIFCELKRCL